MERIYSRHATRECLRAKRRAIKRLLLAEGVEDTPIIREIKQLAQQQRIAFMQLRRDEMNRVTPNHQGVMLEVGDYPYVELDDIFANAKKCNEPPFILVLDALQDPHNFGSLIRTAEAVGVHGIVIAERRSVAVTPAVVNASSGAVEHMRVAQVVNLARAVEELKARDVWVSALHGEGDATPLFNADLKGAVAIIVGGEGEGVHRLLRDKADFILRIPMTGKIESLNAAVAGSVALYEVFRQRRRDL
jgi:23S rRNA (guanosine2251-2'-O)-methyltransferase